MNRAEAKIAVRDQVLANILDMYIGEGTGEMFKLALKQADAEVERVIREQEQQALANAKKFFEKEPGDD